MAINFREKRWFNFLDKSISSPIEKFIEETVAILHLVFERRTQKFESLQEKSTFLSKSLIDFSGIN